jgi:hypothetical protein
MYDAQVMTSTLRSASFERSFEIGGSSGHTSLLGVVVKLSGAFRLQGERPSCYVFEESRVNNLAYPTRCGFPAYTS